MSYRTYRGLPGAYDYYNRPRYDEVGRLISGAQGTAQQAQEYTDTIEQYAPDGGGEFIEPTVQAALSLGMMGGQSQAEYDAGRERVTGGFQTALGNLSSKTAARGYYAPESVQQAAQGKPAAALAGGFANLEASRGKQLREGRAEAGRTAAGLYQYPARAQEARASAYGQAFGRFEQQNRFGGGRSGWQWGPAQSRRF